MPTLIFDPLPAEVEALIKRRHEWGADRHGEVWEGVLHMSPPPSPRHELVVDELRAVLRPLARARGMAAIGAAGIGIRDDHRVPGLTLLRPPAAQWNHTAALAVEVVSPRDETRHKLDFYAAHAVSELVIVDPEARTVDWRVLRDGAYEPVERSTVIDLSAAELHAQIDWDPFPVEPGERG